MEKSVGQRIWRISAFVIAVLTAAENEQSRCHSGKGPPRRESAY